MVALLTQSAQADGNCFVYAPTSADGLQVNAVGQWKVIWQPENQSAQTEESFTFEVPRSIGFIYSEGNLPCTTTNANSFIGGTPTCNIANGFSEDKNGGTIAAFIITVTNLATSSPFLYEVLFDLTNPPTSLVIDPESLYCESQISGGTKYESFFVTGTITIIAKQCDNYPAFTTTATQVGTTGALKIEYELCEAFPTDAYVVLQVPKLNQDYYVSSGVPPLTSMFPSSGIDAKVELQGGSIYNTNETPSTDVIVVEQDSVGAPTHSANGLTYDQLAMQVTGSNPRFAAGSRIIVTISNLNMPVSTKMFQKFVFFTATDVSTNPPAKIERADDGTQDGQPSSSLTMTTPGSAVATAAFLEEKDGVDNTNAHYEFKFTTNNPIPTDGYLQITVPNGSTGIRIPDNDPQTNLVLDCTAICSDSAPQMTYSSNILTIKNIFNSYVDANTAISFSLKGWTNPSTTTKQTFTIASMWEEGVSTYQIDEDASGAWLQAVEGICEIRDMYPTDENTMIMDTPRNYTVQMWCIHQIDPSYGIQLLFPSGSEDWIIMDTSRCEVDGALFTSRYSCNGYNETNKVEIFSFIDTVIPASTLFEFVIADAIINPLTFDTPGVIEIGTVSSDGSRLDFGTYQFEDGYFNTSMIDTFEVTPLDTGVGQFPVTYRFRVIPNGDVPQGSYLQIELPDQIKIYDESSIEKKCGGVYRDTLLGFSHGTLNCKVQGNENNIIKVEDGFKYFPTTNFSDPDIDNRYDPPEFYFELPQFINPRETTKSDPFNITIYNSLKEKLYVWNITDGPTVQMSGAATPGYFAVTRNSSTNGNITWYEFQVKTTNYLVSGDQIYLDLPFPAYYSEDTKCIGRTANLANELVCKVSVDLSRIILTIALPTTGIIVDGFRRDLDHEGRQLASRIEQAEEFKFRVTNIKNPPSFQPTQKSIQYSVFTSSGILIEDITEGYPITNTDPGTLSIYKNGLLPDDFRASFETNYTLEVFAINFKQNMNIILTLPPEISFGTDTVICKGISGTDVDDEYLDCKEDRINKRINITNAVTYTAGNPGEMRIQISKLKNPLENIVTSSFKIETQTSDGWTLDEVTTNITVNFYCQYPCASCDVADEAKCYSCYAAAFENLFHEYECLGACPAGWVGNDSNNCTACDSPCATCENSPSECTSCIEGYTLFGQKKRCREEVFWPFPFIATGLVAFIVIWISECVTKSESRFKEAFIAFWSLPEVAAWCTFVVMVGYRQRDKLPDAPVFILACLALLLYAIVNAVHACIHPRKMVPNTLFSYKTLLTNYKCSTFLFSVISYLISFKFSLILVSYFWLRPRFRGDYSALNWKQFNRLSIVFICLPYPTMMIACAWFLLFDGFFSYPGFVAVEVIVLSTILMVLLLLDALSSIKCKTVGKAKTNKAIKVATGADYESEDEDMKPTKRALRQAMQMSRADRQPEVDEFGVDDSYGSESFDDTRKDKGGRFAYKTPGRTKQLDGSMTSLRGSMNRSHHSFRPDSAQTAVLNEEARRQVAMLEELAHQMREEKRQLQLDKEMIEREKIQLERARENQEHHLDRYMNDYQRQTTALSSQVKQLETEKEHLVQQVEDKLSEGWSANQQLMKKIAEANTQRAEQAKIMARKSYKDIEGEMEDYEPVEEENSEDEQSIPDVIEHVQLPVKPAFGEIDYYRQMQGDEEDWMQQLTPRAGGDSIMGQHDIEDEGQLDMELKSAQFDVVSVPPSRHDAQLEVGGTDANYHECSEKMEGDDSEMQINRSDAEMEINSSVGVVESNQEEFVNIQRPIFSRIKEREEKQVAQEFTQFIEAEFGTVPPANEKEGEAMEYTAFIDAVAGEADKQSELHASEQEFIQKIDPDFGQCVDDGELERTATAVQFFNPEAAQVGDAENRQRELDASGQQFFQHERPVYSQNGFDDPIQAQNNEQRFFEPPKPLLKENASDIDRNALGSEQRYQELTEAALSQNDNVLREREGTAQEFYQREPAQFEKKSNDASATGTQQEFFKQDEAFRGEITSQDKSVSGTQQQWMNMAKPEMGRPEDYERRQADTGVEFFNKSELNMSNLGRAAGAATPHGDITDGGENFLQQSDAEFGRQSTTNKRQATQQNFFENDQNPEYGRGEDFTRGKEQEIEYAPTPLVDESGRSESSEGDIANHNPFNASNALVSQNVQSSMASRHRVTPPMQQPRQSVPQRQQQPQQMTQPAHIVPEQSQTQQQFQQPRGSNLGEPYPQNQAHMAQTKGSLLSQPGAQQQPLQPPAPGQAIGQPRESNIGEPYPQNQAHMAQTKGSLLSQPGAQYQPQQPAAPGQAFGAPRESNIGEPYGQNQPHMAQTKGSLLSQPGAQQQPYQPAAPGQAFGAPRDSNIGEPYGQNQAHMAQTKGSLLSQPSAQQQPQQPMAPGQTLGAPRESNIGEPNPQNMAQMGKTHGSMISQPGAQQQPYQPQAPGQQMQQPRGSQLTEPHKQQQPFMGQPKESMQTQPSGPQHPQQPSPLSQHQQFGQPRESNVQEPHPQQHPLMGNKASMASQPLSQYPPQQPQQYMGQPQSQSTLPQPRESQLQEPAGLHQPRLADPRKSSQVPQPHMQSQPQAPHFMPQPVPDQTSQQEMSQMPEPQVSPGKKNRAVKTILYSDKSETSVEELMDDTPSNYNIQNGRFEGKSLGLKALLLHAKKYNQTTLDPTTQGTLLDEQNARFDNRSPQHARNDQLMHGAGQMGAQKGIIGSQQDERNFVSNLYRNQSMDQSNDGNWALSQPVNAGRVPVIGEESSGHGSTSGQGGFQGVRKKQKPIRTNKQFAEPPHGGMPQQFAQGTRPPQHPQARSPHAQNSQSNRGGQKQQPIRKNNYL